MNALPKSFTGYIMIFISAIGFGFIIFHEELTLLTYLGGGIIILSAMLPDLTTILSRKK